MWQRSQLWMKAFVYSWYSVSVLGSDKNFQYDYLSSVFCTELSFFPAFKQTPIFAVSYFDFSFFQYVHISVSFLIWTVELSLRAEEAELFCATLRAQMHIYKFKLNHQHQQGYSESHCEVYWCSTSNYKNTPWLGCSWFYGEQKYIFFFLPKQCNKNRIIRTVSTCLKTWIWAQKNFVWCHLSINKSYPAEECYLNHR